MPPNGVVDHPPGKPPIAFDSNLLRGNGPDVLRVLPQWVAWRFVRRNDKWTKLPVDPVRNSSASPTDPATWGTFEQAIAACTCNVDLAGVGFVFTASDPFAGVDLDQCIDPTTGQPKPWATAILERLDSYSEISPSGKGVKVFVRASKPGQRCKVAYEDGAIEMYDRERFFTVTGQRLPDTPTDVEERQPQYEAVYELVFGGGDAPQSAMPMAQATVSDNDRSHLDDDDIIRIALRSKKSGEKFKALWEGRWQEHFGSQSEADSSFVFRLAFYTKDAAQVDRLFRRSGLMRDKWDEKHGAQTYGEMTIAGALEKVTSQYFPQNAVMGGRVGARLRGEASLPEIITTDVQLRELTALAVDALVWQRYLFFVRLPRRRRLR